MASSSASLALSFPASSLSQNWEHDVFPSFHGPDVRKNFLSHVLKEFRSKAINLFIDNEIKRGKFIGPALEHAIRASKIAVVLFSKNYASSSCCLDELVEIMKKGSREMVITIFYEVDPTDVKKQTGYFGEVFKNTCQGKGEDKIEIWRKALEGVATIAGYHSSNWVDEAAMIENIAADISKMLIHLTPSCDFDHLIGMRDHMKRMKPLLRLDLDEVRMIGIWGPPGIGKTTIARFLFDQISSEFQHSAIMVNIKGSYPKPCLDEYDAQLQLQSQMLSLMIKEKDIKISHLGVVQGRLGDRKVLLVLDDVDLSAQLNALAKNSQWFGPKSRIIITTENRRLLEAQGVDHIYKVNHPSIDEALQMFCMYAFDQKYPKDGFDELSREITYLVGKLPLALRVMGSHFRRLSKEQWSMEVPRLWTNLNREIESILKFSYDALCDEEKKLFLHLACFFNNEYKEKVEAYLVESFVNVRQGLHVLAEKSLIFIEYDRICMHNLLAQLGKEIVRKQSVCEHGQHRFLVDGIEICEELSNYTSVIGIDFEFKLKITKKAIKEMASLQFLRVESYSGHLNTKFSPGPLTYLSPKLRLLHWRSFPMTYLPFSNNLEFLVELNMPYSKLKKLWDGIKLLQNLKWVDLNNSWNLKKLPNLSTATNLKELNLNGCSSLVKLPSSIGNATNLKELDLSGCSSLKGLPSSIGNATNLQKLKLDGCSSLKELPSSIGNAANLQKLTLDGCSSLKELPSSIGNATNLENLKLHGCSSLKELPSIGNATNLKQLDLSRCSSLVKLPSSIGNATNLEVLDLNFCSSLKELPSSIGNATNLKELDLSGCSSLVKLPSSIGNATNLQELHLNWCSNLVNLPSSIGNLHRIRRFCLSGCSKLKTLPININMESLNSLILTDCSLLTRFPEISTHIQYLYLVGTSIKEVPCSIRSWSPLDDLSMSYSENLKEFPFIHNIITELHSSDPTIQELGPWVKGLSRLDRLVLKGMQKLVSLPKLPDSLRFLDLNGCSSLVSLPELPTSLMDLDAENCESLEKLDCSVCNPYVSLNFINCFKLNQEARDLIIERSTYKSAVLPGKEVPECFTYRAYGSSVTVKLNQKPLPTSTKFRGCILFDDKGENSVPEGKSQCYSLTSKKIIYCPDYIGNQYSRKTDNIYIFEFETEEVTSTEFVFEFQDFNDSEIKECGVIQLYDV